MSQGYLLWSARFGRDNFRLDGVEYSENCFLSFDFAHKDKTPALVGASRSGGTQSDAIGGDQPSNMVERIFNATIDISDEGEYESLCKALDNKGLVDFMPGIWSVDRWEFGLANDDPSTWKTSRGIWYGSPADTATYAPKFEKLNAGSYATWTNLFAGTPTGTQALFPSATTTTPFNIETATQDETEDSEFWARYMGIHWCQITGVSQLQNDVNDWKVQLTLAETFIGSYTGLS